MHGTPAAMGDSEREVARATDSTHSYVLPPFLSVIDVGWTLRHWLLLQHDHAGHARGGW